MESILKFTPSYPLSEFIDYLFIANPATPGTEVKSHRERTHPRILLYSINPSTIMASELRGLWQRKDKAGYFPHQNLSMGVCFRPYGLHTGYNLRGELLNNKNLAPEVLLGKHWKSIAEDMRYCTTTEKIEILHKALYQGLQPQTALDEIAEIVDELVKADLTKGVQQDLARSFEKTPKSFISLFKKTVGITPLQYLHIHKVEAAKELLTKEDTVQLTEVAYLLGFYDQSHFIKVFRTYTGYSPKAFRKLILSG